MVDLAEGHVAALNHLTEGAHIFNLGTGKGTSVLELVEAFEKANEIEVTCSDDRILNQLVVLGYCHL